MYFTKKYHFSILCAKSFYFCEVERFEISTMSTHRTCCDHRHQPSINHTAGALVEWYVTSPRPSPTPRTGANQATDAPPKATNLRLVFVAFNFCEYSLAAFFHSWLIPLLILFLLPFLRSYISLSILIYSSFFH